MRRVVTPPIPSFSSLLLFPSYYYKREARQSHANNADDIAAESIRLTS
jgi:hypothetical protein